MIGNISIYDRVSIGPDLTLWRPGLHRSLSRVTHTGDIFLQTRRLIDGVPGNLVSL